MRDEVPDAALQHEAERVDRPLDDAPALAVAEPDAAAAPDDEASAGRCGTLSSARNQPRRVEVEERRRAARAFLQLLRQRREELQPRRRELAAEPELRGRAGHPGCEKRLCLVARQPREPRAVAAGQPVAARGAAHGLDRHAGGGERLDVAVHRPDRDLEPLGDLRGGQPAARLEQEQQRDEPRRTHFRIMTEDVLFFCQDPGVSIWTDEWDDAEDWSGGGAKSRALVPRGAFLGATVYELDPGAFAIYHAHHGSEELLLVLRGRPTLRTPAGERALDEGEVVSFRPGPEGAHGLRNETDEPVRYVMAGTRVSPEVVDYPDLNQLTAQSRHGVFFIHDKEGEGK